MYMYCVCIGTITGQWYQAKKKNRNYEIIYDLNTTFSFTSPPKHIFFGFCSGTIAGLKISGVTDVRTGNSVTYGTLQHIATHCNILQHSATHCIALQHCNTLQHNTLQHMCAPAILSLMVHCNILQRTAKHCNTLHHTATHCNTLQHTASHCNTMQHNATHCNKL